METQAEEGAYNATNALRQMLPRDIGEAYAVLKKTIWKRSAATHKRRRVCTTSGRTAQDTSPRPFLPPHVTATSFTPSHYHHRPPWQKLFCLPTSGPSTLPSYIPLSDTGPTHTSPFGPGMILCLQLARQSGRAAATVLPNRPETLDPLPFSPGVPHPTRPAGQNALVIPLATAAPTRSRTTFCGCSARAALASTPPWERGHDGSSLSVGPPPLPLHLPPLVAYLLCPPAWDNSFAWVFRPRPLLSVGLGLQPLAGPSCSCPLAQRAVTTRRTSASHRKRHTTLDVATVHM